MLRLLRKLLQKKLQGFINRLIEIKDLHLKSLDLRYQPAKVKENLDEKEKSTLEIKSIKCKEEYILIYEFPNQQPSLLQKVQFFVNNYY